MGVKGGEEDRRVTWGRGDSGWRRELRRWTDTKLGSLTKLGTRGEVTRTGKREQIQL